VKAITLAALHHAADQSDDEATFLVASVGPREISDSPMHLLFFSNCNPVERREDLVEVDRLSLLRSEDFGCCSSDDELPVGSSFCRVDFGAEKLEGCLLVFL
jgi:hypothetical protein